MANTLDPMDLKQIIILHLDGLSNRKIGDTLGISRYTTIKNERFDELMRYFEKVNQARNHPGFTFLYHYQSISICY